MQETNIDPPMSSVSSTLSGSGIQKPFFVGVDVGGTNIKFGLVDDTGRTLAYHTMRTEQDKGAEDACVRMGLAVRQMIREANVSSADVVRVGLATPGPMDIPTGMLLRPGNLPGWWDFPIRARTSHHVGTPVTFANDANAAAYGEYWRGAGAQFRSMVLLTLGTGIGGGIIVGDTLIEGEHSCGSECGHILVNPADDAPMDSLGKRGSLEAHANATAVVERAMTGLRNGTPSSLAQRHAAGEPITPRLVAEAAEKGDGLARNVVMETAYWLAIGIVTLVHTIDPDAVVLGGAMTFGGNDSEIGREFLQRIRDEVRPRLLEPLRDKVRIEFASLGGDAGYIGAAGLARLEYNKGG
jgi:glucokinase